MLRGTNDTETNKLTWRFHITSSYCIRNHKLLPYFYCAYIVVKDLFSNEAKVTCYSSHIKSKVL